MIEVNQNKLLSLNVNSFTETKGKLKYLSWAKAWKEFLKVYPNATYTIKKNPNGTPEFGNSKFGYMVYTEVTVGNVTREMWLFVMNGANKSLKDDGYTYTDRYNKEKTVDAITMFDINKTVMRCLVKNLAMFGLGLYIYSGEDLPEVVEEEERPSNELIEARKGLKEYIAFVGLDQSKIETGYKCFIDNMQLEEIKIVTKAVEKKVAQVDQKFDETISKEMKSLSKDIG